MGILKKSKEQVMLHQPAGRTKLTRQILVLFISFVIVTIPAEAADISRELKIRAAYIYNFAKLVEWPDLSSDVLNVCILENNSMLAAAKNVVEGKTAAGKILKIREVKSSEANQNCNILYFSTPKQVEVLQNIEGLPILTMGDIGDFANKGGIIYLFAESNKIRFEINEKIATANGLTISSKLLSLANNVIH